MIDASERVKEKVEIILRLSSHIEIVGRVVQPKGAVHLIMGNRQDKEGVEVLRLLNDLSYELHHCGVEGVYDDLTYVYSENKEAVSITLRFEGVVEFADTMLVLAGF